MPSVAATPEDFAGTRRYTPTRVLGAGSWGRVYQAYDNERNAFVAVKLLSRANPEALLRFKREFRALKDVVHPNLVTLYELLSEKNQWFFTMEFVDGHTLLDHVLGVRASNAPTRSGRSTTGDAPQGPPTVDWRRPKGFVTSGGSTATIDGFAPQPISAPIELPAKRQPPLSADALLRLRQALGQLVDGLCVLHDAGKLHRDVKPSNVLVTREGRVVLLDFGLVQELEHEPAGREQLIVGTPAYMSPEQSAGRAVREPTDWYAVGVLLYEALTGVVPFENRSAIMLKQRREYDAPPPSELAEGVPEDLDELCVALLARDSERRPTGADLRKMLVRPAPVLRHRVVDPLAPVFGRESELQALHAALAFTKAHKRAALVLLEGASGLGKTAVLRRFLAEAAAGDTIVLEGGCGEMETVPFKAFDAIVDELTACLVRMPSSRRDRLLPKDFSALARLFPVLRRVELPDALKGHLPPVDAHEVRRRGFVALRELLFSLAQVFTVALVIDDAHFGDADSAALLEAVLKAPEFPPLLLVAAFRGEGLTPPGVISLSSSGPLALDAPPQPVVQALKAAARATPESSQVLLNRLSLAPLTHAAAAQLVTALLGDKPVDAARLLGEARGSPHLIEVLCAIAATGATTLHDWARTQLESLPPPSRRLLEVVSVAGRPIERLVAWHAAGLDAEVKDPLVALKAARLLQSDGGSLGRAEQVSAYSTDIGRAVRSLVGPEAQSAALRRLIEAVEASGRIDFESIADWYSQLREQEPASRAAEAAAERAMQVLAFDRAAALYQKALVGRDATDTRRLALARARALAGAGRGKDAASLFLELAAKAASAEDALELKQRAAEQLLFGGHVDEGIAVLADVLSAIGEPLPQSRQLSQLLTLYNRLRIELRGLQFTLTAESEVPRAQLARADAYWAAAKGFSLIDPMRGANFQFVHLRVALASGEPSRVARALAFEAGFHALIGFPHQRQALAALKALESLLQTHPDPQARGLYSLMAGCEAMGRGAFNESRPAHEVAVEHFRDHCPGMTWELSTGLQYLVHALWNLGDYQEVTRLAAEVTDWAKDRHDAYALTNFAVRAMPIVRLMRGEPQAVHREVEAALSSFSQAGYFAQHFWGAAGRTLADLYVGDGVGALQRVRHEWPMLKSSGLFRIQFARVLMTHLRASVRVFDPQATRRELERDARALDAEEVPWAMGLASMVRAAHAFRFGEVPLAIARLQQAADLLEGCGALTHAWAARRWQAVLNGGPGKALERAADQWFKERGVVEPARFAAAFCAGPWSG